jgi:isoquinoline 1-oxidoreductase beta subunit
MTASPEVDRRSFLASAVAIGGGLSLGLRLPFGLAAAEAAVSRPEINAWVVIRPDDTVVIRIARSEMGQGTLTGLAQLVAEELECDWSKVTTETQDRLGNALLELGERESGTVHLDEAVATFQDTL